MKDMIFFMLLKSVRMPILKMKWRMEKCEDRPPPSLPQKKKKNSQSARALWDTARHIRSIRKELMANIMAASGKLKYFYFYNINILSLAD